jgi:beta-glucosidase
MLMKPILFAGWINQLGYQIDNELKEIYLPFMSSQKEIENKRREKEGLLATPKRFVEFKISKELAENKAQSAKMH